MYEVVNVNFEGKLFKDILRGSWQATVARIINRNQNRKPNSAWQQVQQVKEIAKDHWVVKLYRCNARQTPVEFSKEMTVSIEKKN